MVNNHRAIISNAYNYAAQNGTISIPIGNGDTEEMEREKEAATDS